MPDEYGTIDRALMINDETDDLARQIQAGEEAVDADGRTIPGVVRATFDPGASTDQYPVDTIWINTQANPRKVFLCVDNTPTAAVWVRLDVPNRYQYVVDDPETKTTGTVFIEKVVLQTPTLSGTYRVWWTANVIFNQRQGRLRIRDTTNDVVLDDHIAINNDAASYPKSGGFVDVVFNNQARRIAMEFALLFTSGQAFAAVRSARLSIARFQ